MPGKLGEDAKEGTGGGEGLALLLDPHPGVKQKVGGMQKTEQQSDGFAVVRITGP